MNGLSDNCIIEARTAINLARSKLKEIEVEMSTITAIGFVNSVPSLSQLRAQHFVLSKKAETLYRALEDRESDPNGNDVLLLLSGYTNDVLSVIYDLTNPVYRNKSDHYPYTYAYIDETTDYEKMEEEVYQRVNDVIGQFAGQPNTDDVHIHVIKILQKTMKSF